MKREGGFTLIELILVIAILAIIAAVAVPNIIFAIDEARISSDTSNAKLIADSIQMVITKDNGIDRVDINEVEFSDNVVGESAAVEALIEAAAVYLQDVPTAKYRSYAGTPFTVSVGIDTGIVVKIDTHIVYPIPEGDWSN